MLNVPAARIMPNGVVEKSSRSACDANAIHTTRPDSLKSTQSNKKTKIRFVFRIGEDESRGRANAVILTPITRNNVNGNDRKKRCFILTRSVGSKSIVCDYRYGLDGIKIDKWCQDKYFSILTRILSFLNRFRILNVSLFQSYEALTTLLILYVLRILNFNFVHMVL